MSETNARRFRRGRKILLAVVAIFALSFVGTDYYLRGHFYYSKRAVNFLFQHTWQAVFPPSGPVTLYVRMIADQDYVRGRAGWDSHLRDLLEAADRRFSEEFGIRFKLLGIREWERPEALADYPEILTYAAKKIDLQGAQILIIMTGKDLGAVPPSRWVDIGIAHRLGNCVVVGDDSQLIHELGHLFGAVDYPPGDPAYDTETLYSYKYAKSTGRIDPSNHDRILKNKHRLLW